MHSTATKILAVRRSRAACFWRIRAASWNEHRIAKEITRDRLAATTRQARESEQNRPDLTDKRTKPERHAAWRVSSGVERSGLNPTVFPDAPCWLPQTSVLKNCELSNRPQPSDNFGG